MAEAAEPEARTVIAGNLQRGDLLTHERRQYRVSAVGPVVRYRPRQDSVTVVRVTMRPTRKAGGRAVELDLEPCERVKIKR